MTQESVFESLLLQIERTQDGEPWFGSAREAALSGVTAEQALAHPIAGAPSIWEEVLHMTAWTGEVTRRLGGAKPGAPLEGDWPAVVDSDEDAWAAACAALRVVHRELLDSAKACSPARLGEVIGEVPSPSLGTGTTVAGTLIGLAQHDAYHVGQLFLLRRALKVK
ncbi:MAG: DinB family protein [Gemmatimonadota bacterium]